MHDASCCSWQTPPQSIGPRLVFASLPTARRHVACLRHLVELPMGSPSENACTNGRYPCLQRPRRKWDSSCESCFQKKTLLVIAIALYFRKRDARTHPCPSSSEIGNVAPKRLMLKIRAVTNLLPGNPCIWKKNY